MSQNSLIAQTLSPEESVKILLNYRDKHPIAARELNRFIGLSIIKASSTEIEKQVREALPVVALVPVSRTQDNG